ncbi:hypothetical protein [Hymenobacter negativus]|uniref:DUF2157 domain-containing protein n=1 Tax=Hymenobacter negativus TaxID=2795026 RepID=A0ABS3Q8N9_9BACT|nr:hypothetical protein [Hymenobacter negativus]MBO2007610.1 hypothetical protein [Hymenobacter negativus]
MPTNTFYLDDARTEAVTASWNMFFRNFRLDYQGQELGRLTPAELKAGHEFALPDGRRLLVRLQQKFGAQGLDFQVDGRPLGGTINDPLTQIKTAFVAIMLIAGLNVVLSVMAMLGSVEFLVAIGFGGGTLAEGLVYAGLGWLGKFRRAAWAFYAALGLLVLDGVMLLGSDQGSAGMVVRVLLGIAIYRGATAARQLRTTAGVVNTD